MSRAAQSCPEKAMRVLATVLERLPQPWVARVKLD